MQETWQLIWHSATIQHNWLMSEILSAVIHIRNTTNILTPVNSTVSLLTMAMWSGVRTGTWYSQ